MNHKVYIFGTMIFFVIAVILSWYIGLFTPVSDIEISMYERIRLGLKIRQVNVLGHIQQIFLRGGDPPTTAFVYMSYLDGTEVLTMIDLSPSAP